MKPNAAHNESHHRIVLAKVDRCPSTPAGRVIGAALERDAALDELTRGTAAVIYGFDQEALEQSWDRLSEHRRQPYYDIAEAVLAHVREHRGELGA